MGEGPVVTSSVTGAPFSLMIYSSEEAEASYCLLETFAPQKPSHPERTTRYHAGIITMYVVERSCGFGFTLRSCNGTSRVNFERSVFTGEEHTT